MVKAGISAGDLILAMNEQSVVGRSLTEVVFALRSSIDGEIPMTICNQPFAVTVQQSQGGGDGRSKHTVPVHKSGSEQMAIKLVRALVVAMWLAVYAALWSCGTVAL